MTLSRRPLALAAALSLLATPALTAQTPAPAPAQLAPAPDTANPNRQITRLAQPGGVAISPDGTSVTYTLGGRRGGGLHVVSVADPKDDKVLAPTGPAGCSSGDPVWSPDSQTLAILSTCTTSTKPGQEEVLLWSRATGQFKQLTHLIGNLQQLAWAPDGKSLAFLFVENATRSAGALDAMPPWDGVIGEDHVEIQRVFGVEVASGRYNWLSVDPKLHVFEFAWSPDSRQLTYIAAPAPGENNWWVAKLYTQYLGVIGSCEDRPSGTICMNEGAPMGIPTVVLDTQTVASPLHNLQIAVPRYSPDGKQIAFIGGLMSDQGSTGGDVWVIPSTGAAASGKPAQPIDITPNIDGTPCFEAWLNDDTIGIVEDRSGRTVLPDYSVSKRAMVPGSLMDLGETTISGGPIKDAVTVSFTARLLAYAKSGVNTPPEVWVGRTGYEKQITHLNDGVKTLGPRFESVEWENEGFHVQGWLTFPRDYDAHKKYPIIVEVHGGPSASAGPRPSTAWSDQGYFVLAPNPRGSFGQGEKFVQANVKDFGYGDLRDILKGLDTVEAKYPIDKHREGLTGWSYGGFMSMFAETQTTRFAAIVAGAGISDWQSYYGENSIDQWMVPFFGATVYDDPKVYARSSAIEFIKNAKTPMLIIVGDRDGECPAPQSFEMWHALKAEGVPTQLVIYPNEGHGFRNPAHIADRMAREIKWFAKYMPAGRE